MPAIIRELIEGETDPFTLPLYEDGVALNGTGLILTDLLLTGNDGTVVTTVGKFTWANQGGGTVTYSPGATDFLAAKSAYRLRVLLTDGAANTRYYPNGDAVWIRVRAAR